MILDIINVIASYSEPKDAYNLLKIFNLDNIIKQNIINEINTRLYEIFGDKYNKLKSLMADTGCVISGSFIIQCILKENWEGADIDIYVPMRGNDIYDPENFYLFNDHGKTYDEDQTHYMKSDVDDFMYNKMYFDGAHANYDSQINGRIIYVRDYTVHDRRIREQRFQGVPRKQYKTIQIIGVDIDKYSTKSFIDETFDFSICKNMYYYDGKDNIILSNLDDIFNKTLDFVSSRLLSSSIARYHKYKKRGFTFKNKDLLTYDDLKHSDKLTTICRKANYVNEEYIKNDFFGDNLIVIYDNKCPCSSSFEKYFLNDKSHINCPKCDDECIVNFHNPDIKHNHYNIIVMGNIVKHYILIYECNHDTQTSQTLKLNNLLEEYSPQGLYIPMPDIRII